MSNVDNQRQNSIAVMGLPLANVTAGEAVERIERLILSGGTHQVATANLDFWLNSLNDVDLHRIIAGCSLVLPDGMPLVWLSRLLGTPLKERVSGVDMVPLLADLSARKGYGIYLLGGREGVAERASKVLEQQYPGVNIVGHYAPPLADLERMDHGNTLDRIRAVKPDILLVAFGNPKQEKWIRMHSKRLGVPVSIGIGGSLDILVGDTLRAPLWMQYSGLEWLGRCLQEPTRLIPRYARNFKGLAIRFPLAWLASLLQQPYRGVSRVFRTTDPGMVHLRIQGNLMAETADALNRAVTTCIQGGQLLIVHLQDLDYADTEGLGVLIDARQRLMATGLSLSLASVPAKMKLLFAAWCINPLFDEFKTESDNKAREIKVARALRFADLLNEDNPIPAKSKS